MGAALLVGGCGAVGFSAAGRLTPLTRHSSSTVAARTALSEPKCRSSARARASPTPSMRVRVVLMEDALRCCRWYPIAQRCTSSWMEEIRVKAVRLELMAISPPSTAMARVRW